MFQRTLGTMLLALGLSGSGHAATDDAALLARAGQLFAPLPTHAGSAEHPASPQRVALGRLLFFEPRVSLDGTASCARCHQPALYGTDALPKSIGAAGRVNARNAPPSSTLPCSSVNTGWATARTSKTRRGARSSVRRASAIRISRRR